MRIGLYVTTLQPKGAAQARFQESVLAGLFRQNVGRHQFVVFSHVVPDRFKSADSVTYVRLQRENRQQEVRRAFKRHFARASLFACRKLGLKMGKIGRVLQSWKTTEPAYFEQLKESGIRLMWFVNGHELPSWLPYMITVWAVNHRIHPMYPEFSYTRFKFEGSDAGMEQSFARASYLITGTEVGKREIVSIFGVYEHKVRVIPFPTPLLPDVGPTPVPQLPFKHDAPYVFYPARFWPHKNHVVILAALKVLREKWNLTVNLVFSGADEGNLGYVLDYAQRLGLANQVVHLGEVPNEEMVKLYRGALALVYASAVGPDNLPPLEAMSVSCPVIAAEVSGAREQYGDACLFFPPMGEVALARQIKLLLEDPPTREALIAKGITRSAQWSVDDYAGSVLSIIDEFELAARSWGSSDAVFT